MKISCYSVLDRNLGVVCCALLRKIYENAEKAIVLSTLETKIQSLSDLLWSFSNDFIAHSTIYDAENFEMAPIIMSSLSDYKNFNSSNVLVFYDIELKLLQEFCIKYKSNILLEFDKLFLVTNNFDNEVKLQKFCGNIFDVNLHVSFFSHEGSDWIKS